MPKLLCESKLKENKKQNKTKIINIAYKIDSTNP